MSFSSTTTEAEYIEFSHPGEILQTEFLDEFGVTQHKLAVAIRVPPRRINEIVHGKRSITADTAVRLARYFGTSDEFWLNLQRDYDLRLKHRALDDELAKIVPFKSQQSATAVN